MEEKDKAPLISERDLDSLERDDDFLPAKVWVPQSVWRVTKSVVLWVIGFILDIFKALWSFCLTIYRICTKGVLALWKSVKALCHKFRYNDWAGRTSFVLFGTSNFRYGRLINGFLFLAFEIIYIVVFALYGAGCIRELGTLGDVKESTFVETDPVLGTGVTVPADNSVLVLIYGILWCFSLVLFLFVWAKSIDSGYKNYRIAHFNDFDRRTKVAKPYSDLIDRDIADNDLYSHPKSALRDRYSEVYAALDAKAAMDEQEKVVAMDRAYYRYILDSTISYRLDFHKKLMALRGKKGKLESKISAVESDETRRARLDELKRAAEEAERAYDEAEGKLKSLNVESMSLTYEAPDARHGELVDLKREVNSLHLKKIYAEDKAATYSQRWIAKADKIKAKLRKVDASIEDMVKVDLSFSTVDSVENQSKYGKFNVYYKVLSGIDEELFFYDHYDEIVAIYDKGLVEYSSANEANLAARDDLAKRHAEKIGAINKQFDEIEARRSSIEGLREKEKQIYADAKSAIEADSSLGEADKRARLSEVKAKFAYNLKTIKGKLLSLPSKKEVKLARKEDLTNANNAYKRDFRGLKTNYSPEEYATYAASNKLIVDFGVDYAKAYAKVRREIAKDRLTTEDVKKKIDGLRSRRAGYVSDTPTKFDGKPRTFLGQLRSLLDENFHVTLLFLPILGVLFFTLMPLVLSILVAFTNYDFVHTPPQMGFSWSGLLNFKTLFSSTGRYANLAANLGGTVVWTFVWAICATFSNYFLGIIFALMINKEGIKFKKLWRFLFMISIAVPQFISLIAVGTLLKDSGALGNWWFETFGWSLGFSTSVANGALSSKMIIILVNIWVGIPYTILQTTGILMNIPKDLYESSKIDGANSFVQFTKITMPYIFFVTGPSLIQSFIGNVNNFGVIYFLTGGNPINNEIIGGQLGYTDLLVTYLFKLVTVVNNQNYGLASAIGILVFVICAFVSIVMYNRSSAVSGEDTFQ